ncbi:MAG TPA: allene oxide cyclase family protein, partial [Marmoricola sp.]
ERAMRTRVIIASTTVAVTVAAGAVAVGAANASSTGAAVTTGRHITVVERAVSDTVVDTGPKGDSQGDLLSFANPVFNAANSKKVGHDNGSCIRTRVGRAWECSWTTRLARGSLVVEGPFLDKHDSTLAITGGTGAYSRARGVMHLHARNAMGTAYTFAFVVQR